MYRYVPTLLPSTYFFAYSCTDFSTSLKGTYRVHADSGGVRTFGSWFYCAPAGQPSQFAREQFRHRPTHWTKSHKSTGRFIYCCLAAPLSVPERLPGWALALVACWGIPLWLVSFTQFAVSMISCLLTSSTSPSQQRCAHCKWACEGLWLQVGASMMSCKICKQSCKVQVQRFYQRDKTKSWSGLKLSSADGDWDVDLEQWLEYQGYYCEIFKQSCKVQRFNQRDKTKS
jgi:hypothetical protein